MSKEFTIGENYKLKIGIINTSDHREYLNIFIKNTSTNEEYNSNFDFDYMKTKAFSDYTVSVCAKNSSADFDIEFVQL